MFFFFLQSYRKGILTFCGSEVIVQLDPLGPDSKYGFRLFENGVMKLEQLKSSQPNILRSVIIGKKSWGLFLQQWSEGIVEGSFTKREILEEFEGINIPECLILDLENTIRKKILKKIENYE